MILSFSIIMSVRNGARYLPETIGSIQQQSLTDWELIINNNAAAKKIFLIITFCYIKKIAGILIKIVI